MLPQVRSPAWLVLALALGAGCVTIYEPMGALQKPVVIDPRLPNFGPARVGGRDVGPTRIFVRCLPVDEKPKGLIPSIDLFPSNDADKLCQQIYTLFANQGADVEISVPQSDGADTFPAESGKPDLIIDLKSRTLFNEESTFLGVLSCYSCTLIPSMHEVRFAQEVTVRDGDGSVLTSEVFKSRFVTYGGCGVWSINALIDLIGRSDDQDLTGDAPQRDHSRDFYGQVTQLAFNARTRSRILHNFEAPGPPVENKVGAPPTPPPPPTTTPPAPLTTTTTGK